MTTVVYVSNADSGDISVLHLDRDCGALVPVQAFATGGKVMPLAIGPDRRCLYASLRDEPARVMSCSIEPSSGRLSRLHEAALPASACHIALDRSGRWLFSASYGGHRIGVNPIDAEGRAQAPHQDIATPPNAHALRTDLSNRFAFAACLGGGVVLQMRFDEASGLLANDPLAALQLPAGAGPRHLEFHPDGDIVYLLNELDATLTTLELDQTQGRLQARHTVALFPPGVEGTPWGAELHLSPDARHLYASERRSSTLGVFRVQPATRELLLLAHVPTEAQPRGFGIDASGRWLVAAGQRSHRVGVHAIDPPSGLLSARHSHAVGTNPNWVEMIDLP
jgi:6-phosphogluconolactonase